METEEQLLQIPTSLRDELLVELGYATGKCKSDAVQYSLVHKVWFGPRTIHTEGTRAATVFAYAAESKQHSAEYDLPNTQVPFLSGLDNVSLTMVCLKLNYEKFQFSPTDETVEAENRSTTANQLMIVSTAPISYQYHRMLSFSSGDRPLFSYQDNHMLLPACSSRAASATRAQTMSEERDLAVAHRSIARLYLVFSSVCSFPSRHGVAAPNRRAHLQSG